MPTLLDVAPALTQLPPYEVFAARVDLVAQYNNPYDYDEVAVEVQLAGPAGAGYSVDGFYQEALRVDPATGIVAPRQAAGFYFRFTPNRPGTWRYTVRVTDQDGSSDPIAGSFECRGAPEGRGFVRRVNGNYLQCDNGDAFIPIGENLAWPQGDPFVSYRNWLTELAESGGNYLRLWHAHWGLGIEWKKEEGTFAGLRRYNATNMAYLDWLFDHCAERDLRILLALHHHGPVSTKVDPNWSDSPYQLANGGPCRHPWEFFTDATAKAHTRNRLRYCVARWGHSPALLAWELFNEVDWTDQYPEHRQAVTDWHLDMAAFLKEIDPYGHLVTTSYAKAQYEPAVWQSGDIDFTQTHHYHDGDNLERALVARTRQHLRDYRKPTLNAEFGLGGSLDLDALDPAGIHLHNALWAGLFGGGMGTAMTWWWDTYVHPRQLFRHFTAIRAVSDRIPFIAGHFTPADLSVTSVPVALSLVPLLGWAERATESSLFIDASGTVPPTPDALSRYLYGARWNRRYRRPPTFRVDYPRAGSFTVRTGGGTGKQPLLRIRIDGVPCLRTRARPAQSYHVAVPAGVHTIEVDNIGKDWISIAAYEFSEIGSALDGYGLIAENQRSVAGWVLNHRYHHRQLATGREPDPVVGAVLRLPGFAEGDFSVSWYDCKSGALVARAPVAAREGVVSIPVPPVRWDLAFIVDEPAIAV